MANAAQPAYQIGRSPGTCAVSGRTLEAGERYVAALVDNPESEGFERVEYSMEAWEGGARPVGLFGYWRATVPEKDAKPKLLVDDESLLELFDSLEEAPDQAALRFVLTLLLLRKRLLKHVGQRHTSEAREMLVRRRGEPTDAPAISVVDPGLGADEVETIAGQLEPLLLGDA